MLVTVFNNASVTCQVLIVLLSAGVWWRRGCTVEIQAVCGKYVGGSVKPTKPCGDAQ